MSNNLHKHSKDPGFQAIYRVSKLEKANEELVNRINNELLPAIKQLQQDREVFRRGLILALLELGGSITMTAEDLSRVCSKLEVKYDPDTYITTYKIGEEEYIPKEDLSVSIKIDTTDTGCCGSDCGYLNNGDPLKPEEGVGFCSLYLKELYGIGCKTRCPECHEDNNPE